MECRQHDKRPFVPLFKLNTPRWWERHLRKFFIARLMNLQVPHCEMRLEIPMIHATVPKKEGAKMKPDGFLLRWMNPLFSVSVFLFLLFLISGCGGGGGTYYQLETPINTIDLHKVELSKTNIETYTKSFFPVSYSDSKLRDKQVEKGEKIFGTSGYFQEVNYLGQNYYLHSNSFFMGVDIIRSSDMKKVGLLTVPRSVFEFASFSLAIENEVFLVVYVEQRATSHSSTLFIVDSHFKIVYQEHLLGAEEIGYTHSDKYGNCIILKSENFWFPNGTDKPKVSLNGDWLYYIPEKTAP